MKNIAVVIATLTVTFIIWIWLFGSPNNIVYRTMSKVDYVTTKAVNKIDPRCYESNFPDSYSYLDKYANICEKPQSYYNPI